MPFSPRKQKEFLTNARHFYSEFLAYATQYRKGGDFAKTSLQEFREDYRAIELARQRCFEMAETVAEARELALGFVINGHQLLKLRLAPSVIITLQTQALKIARLPHLDKLDDYEAYLLVNLSGDYGQVGNYKEGKTCARRAIELARASGNRELELAAKGNLGVLSIDLPEPDSAPNPLTDLDLTDSDSEYALAQASALGNMRMLKGEFKAALKYYQTALDIARKSGHLVNEAKQLVNIGVVYTELNQLEKAWEFVQQGLAISKPLEDKAVHGECLGQLGNIRYRQQQFREAVEYFESALELAAYETSQLHLANRHFNAGAAYFNLHEIPKAQSHFEAALPLFIALNLQDWVKSTRDMLGKCRKNPGAF